MSDWISIEERLPEEDQDVVFASFYNWSWSENMELDSVVAGYFRKGSFYPSTEGLEASNYDGSASIYLNMTPTHWMPLPGLLKDGQ